MKFEHTLTANWQNALRGLRNPMNSWAASDSEGGICEPYGDEFVNVTDAWVNYKYPDLEHGSKKYYDACEIVDSWLCKNAIIRNEYQNSIIEWFAIGPKDMELAQRMIQAGSPNDKFLRQIFVSVDITAPGYFLKELDTYKVSTTRNSTSTMHKLASTPITLDCFETDDYDDSLPLSPDVPSELPFEMIINTCETLRSQYLQTKDKKYWKELIHFLLLSLNMTTGQAFEMVIDICEILRTRYLRTKDKKYWKELIRLLPFGWSQTSTWTANYAVLRNIIHWRQGHKLSEWKSFIDWCRTLPYSESLLFYCNEPGKNG